MFSKNLEASLGPAEAEFGAVAKADQYSGSDKLLTEADDR